MTLIIILLIFLMASFICFCVAFYVPAGRRMKYTDYFDHNMFNPYHDYYWPLVEKLAAEEYEAVETQSFDGIRLAGRLYIYNPGGPFVIFMHGYKANCIGDYAGCVGFYRDLGYNILLTDERAEGNSGGKTITFGACERYDCLSWIEYISERFGSPETVLHGLSMGAATVLCTLSEDLPSNVVKVVSDCAFSSAAAMMSRYATPFGYLAVAFGALVFGNFRLNSVSPVKSVKKARIPVLFIHGEADELIPIKMCRKLYDACASEKYLFTVPGAGHAVSSLKDPEGCKKALTQFLKG